MNEAESFLAQIDEVGTEPRAPQYSLPGIIPTTTSLRVSLRPDPFPAITCCWHIQEHKQIQTL